MATRTRADEQLYREALKLPASRRAQLGERLLESVDFGPEEPAQAVEAAWREEIARRIAGADSGKAKAIPWAQVKRQVFGSARGARKR